MDLAAELMRAGDCDVIVTDAGADINILARGENIGDSVSPPAVSPVDTTGAGDIFQSRAYTAYCRDLPLTEAVKWGAAAGSLMCQFAGTTKTLAPLSDVRALLATQCLKPRIGWTCACTEETSIFRLENVGATGNQCLIGAGAQKLPLGERL